jgi:hypothetical protein
VILPLKLVLWSSLFFSVCLGGGVLEIILLSLIRFLAESSSSKLIYLKLGLGFALMRSSVAKTNALLFTILQLFAVIVCSLVLALVICVKRVELPCRKGLLVPTGALWISTPRNAAKIWQIAISNISFSRFLGFLPITTHTV